MQESALDSDAVTVSIQWPAVNPGPQWAMPRAEQPASREPAADSELVMSYQFGY